MNSRRAAVMGLIAIMVLILPEGYAGAGAGDASEVVASAEASRPDGTSLVTMTEEQAARLSPLHRAMREVLITERVRLASLFEEFTRETDSRRALLIQRQIHDVKLEAEVSLLRVQAEAARAAGRTEDAERLEEGIARLIDPRPTSASPMPTTRAADRASRPR
jgi:hypothetical protein